jgi:hypothetical protein
VNAYPHAIDTFFLGCRVLLRDDRMLDFAQAPFGVIAALAVAAMARRAGASAPRAIAFGALYLAVPIVMLQLATSYVDVAYAALLATAVHFATAPFVGAPSRAEIAVFGVAAGLFLGSKPSAPPIVALLAAIVVARAWRARASLVTGALASLVIALAIGGGSYVANAIAHHNPVWPVIVGVGPWSLPGEAPASGLFVQGLPESLANAGWLSRLLASLFAKPVLYIYDMRLGGFGPLVAFGLMPVALFVCARARDRARLAAPVLLALLSLATPAAHWTRYTMAFPAALLAVAAIGMDAWPARVRAIAELALGVLAIVGVARALPGFTGGGPSLAAVLAMDAPERARAVGVDGHEELWIDARARAADGEAVVYDASFSLPGLLWRADGKVRVVYLDSSVASSDLLGRMDRERARVIVAGDGSPAARAIDAERDRFALLFRCPLDACNVYERLRDAPVRVAR